MIQITHTDGNARSGFLSLPHGKVETPAFMPVGTNGTVKAITLDKLKSFGYTLILGNTYHLYLRPGESVLQHFNGLHDFTSWNSNILTDSGGFQVFSLAEFRKIKEEGVKFRSHIDGSYHVFTPENVVDFQTLLNSDIQMVLDVCTPPGITEKKADEALQITTRWAKRAKAQYLYQQDENQYKGLLFGIVQGNFYHDLRKKSAEQIVDLDFPGVAIGGLSVGETKSQFIDFLNFTSGFLPMEKPRYVMGIGTPDYILEAVDAGIDMFDCVYPTRVARNSTVFSNEGMVSLKKEDYKYDKMPIDTACECNVCKNYSRAYLRHLFKAGEILGPMLATEHNLYFMSDFMKKLRRSIEDKSFKKFKGDFLEKFYSKA